MRISLPLLLLGVTSLVPLATARSQEQTAASSIQLQSPDDYLVRTWTTADGLPANHIIAIHQTQDGYLWLATGSGLVRFDGKEFRIFTSEDIEGWHSSFVGSLYEDRDGTLWIFSYSGEVARYRGGRFETVLAGTQNASPLVLNGYASPSFHQARDGAIWIADYNRVIRIRGDAVETFAQRDGLPGRGIVSIHEAEDGTIWAVTRHRLARFDGERFEAYGPPYQAQGWIQQRSGVGVWIPLEDTLLHFQEGRFTALVPGAGLPAHPAKLTSPPFEIGRNGTIWMGLDAGLLRLDGKGYELYSLPENIRAGVLYPRREGRAGVLWLSSVARHDAEPNQLIRFENGHFETIELQAHLDFLRLTFIFEDAAGGLWVGTDSGLIYLTPRKVTAYSTRQGLSNDFIWPVYENREGTLWIGTWGGGLNRIQEGRVSVLPVGSGSVRSLHEDRAGNLWVGTRNGLYVKRRDGRLEPVLTSAMTADTLDLNVRVIEEDRRGALWFGGDQFLFRLYEGELTRVPQVERSNVVFDIHEDQNGALWFATRHGLLCLTEGEWRTYTTRDGLSSSFVASLYEEANGTLWISTHGAGLNRLQDGSFFSFTSAHGLFEEGIWQILEDDFGHFWMSTDHGIVRVRKQELYDVASGRSDRVHPLFLNEADGMPSAECTSAKPGGWKARDGRLWFPTIKGLAVVDPARFEQRAWSPPVHIDRVVAGGQPLDLASPAEVAPGLRNLEFHYTALNFSAPEKGRYRYRLEGYDTNWVEAETRRTAFYTNLPPGRYTFRVLSDPGDGSRAEASFSIRLRPFFYQTGWFVGLCLVLAGLLVYGGYQYDRRRLRERELEKLVRERTAGLEAEKQRTEAQAAQLAEQAGRLQDLDRMKSRFFANLSHEFRTPLALILGPLSDLLGGQQGPLSLAVRQAIETACRNAARIEQLIEQLLDLTRLEAGRLTLRPVRADLVAFLGELVRAFVPLAERRRLTLQFQPAVEQLICGFDPEQLRKIVGNLLSNGLKFTPAHGKVQVVVDATAAGVEIRVYDTGRGIPADAVAHIFNRFYQIDDPTAPREGTGIGLSLARELAQLHGGDLYVESRPGFGSVFTFRFPESLPGSEKVADRNEGRATAWPAVPALHESLDATATSTHAPMDSPAPPPPGERPVVLVVEDNDELLHYLREHLAQVYDVAEARNGVEAVEGIPTWKPDLIVSDVMMPAMDGFELLRVLKSDERYRDIPFVLLTARAEAEDQLHGLHLGADDYLHKPFDIRTLLARLHNLIQARREMRSRYSREIVVQPSGIVVTPADEIFLERVRSVVEAHMGDNGFNVDAFAQEVALSRSQLNRRLRDLTGKSAAAFIRELRLQRAAQLLAGRHGSVAEVAYAIGFNDVDHFSNLFKVRFGVPPSSYRVNGA